MTVLWYYHYNEIRVGQGTINTISGEIIQRTISLSDNNRNVSAYGWRQGSGLVSLVIEIGMLGGTGSALISFSVTEVKQLLVWVVVVVVLDSRAQKAIRIYL